MCARVVSAPIRNSSRTTRMYARSAGRSSAAMRASGGASPSFITASQLSVPGSSDRFWVREMTPSAASTRRAVKPADAGLVI